jgi:CYTH domain-containing protein
LPDENTAFTVPEWLGEEISSDRRYTNRALSRNPYSTWSSEDK